MFLCRTYPSLQRSALFVAEANDGAVVGCIGVKVKQASSQVYFELCSSPVFWLHHYSFPHLFTCYRCLLATVVYKQPKHNSTFSVISDHFNVRLIFLHLSSSFFIFLHLSLAVTVDGSGSRGAVTLLCGAGSPARRRRSSLVESGNCHPC